MYVLEYLEYRPRGRAPTRRPRAPAARRRSCMRSARRLSRALTCSPADAPVELSRTEDALHLLQSLALCCKVYIAEGWQWIRVCTPG